MARLTRRTKQLMGLTSSDHISAKATDWDGIYYSLVNEYVIPMSELLEQVEALDNKAIDDYWKVIQKNKKHDGLNKIQEAWPMTTGDVRDAVNRMRKLKSKLEL